MKNIHVLPTKPNDETGKGIWIEKTRDWCNIYITSDEEIKEGDWRYNSISNTVYQKKLDKISFAYEYKITLTTDQDLIKEGVQTIDDEFLEWFVKNPACEFVEVEFDYNSYKFGKSKSKCYKIIIPKQEQKQHLINMMRNDEELGLYEEPEQTDEKGQPLTYWGGLAEPKQETLEEVDENKKNLYYYKQIMNPYPVDEYSYTAYEKGFVDGYEKASKWQEKQDKKMYSEEIIDILDNVRYWETCPDKYKIIIEEWFEQFKKK